MSTASCSSGSDNVDSLVADRRSGAPAAVSIPARGNMPRRARLKGSGNVGTTADAVYGTLRRSILDGDLPPGHRLRSDALAHDLNVSRTPVREALRKLEAEGLVDAAPSGLVVRQLTEQDLTEIFYLREALEGMAARLAAENATRTDIDELHALVDDMGAVAAGG